MILGTLTTSCLFLFHHQRFRPLGKRVGCYADNIKAGIRSRMFDLLFDDEDLMTVKV